MILYHTTSAYAAESIMRETEGLLINRGIDPGLSKGKIKGVWLTSKVNVPWSIAHLLAKGRPHCKIPKHVRVLRVQVPRGWLRRFRRGIWYSTRCIPPVRIQSITEGPEWALNYPGETE